MKVKLLKNVAINGKIQDKGVIIEITEELYNKQPETLQKEWFEIIKEQKKENKEPKKEQEKKSKKRNKS